MQMVFPKSDIALSLEQKQDKQKDFSDIQLLLKRMAKSLSQSARPWVEQAPARPWVELAPASVPSLLLSS